MVKAPAFVWGPSGVCGGALEAVNNRDAQPAVAQNAIPCEATALR